ncbi:GspE/PulE family protein [Candidatus Nitronereus thalassa]|uniref:GspE/PulE family protein n=1 Tax=Candidatus Nitronereus thalassa TaxID=3020898 RepID=A0ABU3K7R9_9BACT|nr:GspE/PulE family protein [Candidatus Nitronereus thalassa]MDT7042368.1 GspE/PulE family protein [Candidatus Nitronereus thalassa]
MTTDTASPTKTKPLGQRLLEAGFLTEDQLSLALRELQRLGGHLGETLINLGFITQDVLSAFLAQQTASAVIDLANVYVEREVLDLVPYELAKRLPTLPIKRVGDVLTVALVNTMDVVAVDTLERKTGLVVNVVSAPLTTLLDAVDQFYAQSGTIDETVDQLLRQGLEQLEEGSGIEAPMIRLCNQIISLAIKDRATDIHIEPDEKILRVRLRVDGVLRQEVLMPKQLQAPVIARFKLMANLNVTEKRLPQDGHITFTAGHRPVDLRISSLPTSFGESVVMRILDKSSVKHEMVALGLSERNQTIFEQAMKRTHGIVLVTGPTGSGKNTTLYTGLQAINTEERSVFTLEDPIEYELPLVRQTQINSDIGMTFPVGLRALLRQDPDVIMVGEIRDRETAELSIRAAFTGHLVLSTLHTNDAIGALPRLMDMGVEPFLLPPSLIAIIGQRLIRRLCDHCKSERPDAELVLQAAEVKVPPGMSPRLWEGKGCELCGGSGYRGRIGIFEILAFDERYHEAILHGPDLKEIARLAKEAGMRTMIEDGIDKALNGVTTVEEVLRVIHG